MRRVALVTLCATLAGCRTSTGTAGELHLEVIATQPSVRAGHVLNLTVLASNPGDAPVTFVSPDCWYPYEVRDARGAHVAPAHGVVCAAVLTGPRTLLPGERRAFASAWIVRTGTNQDPVEPGVYDLRPANFRPRGANVALRSLSVTVTP